jgi:hypothetical protein
VALTIAHLPIKTFQLELTVALAGGGTRHISGPSHFLFPVLQPLFFWSSLALKASESLNLIGSDMNSMLVQHEICAI